MPLIAFALAACTASKPDASNDRTDNPSSTTSATPTIVVETTTSHTRPRTTTTVPILTSSAAAPALYSFDGTVPPPTLNATGIDLDQVVPSLLSYIDWLRAHNPDPALVGEVAEPDTPYFDELVAQLTLLRSENYRFYAPPRSFTIDPGRRFGSREFDAYQSVDVYFEAQVTGTLIDSTEDITKPIILPIVAPLALNLYQDDAGRWRIMASTGGVTFTKKE